MLFLLHNKKASCLWSFPLEALGLLSFQCRMQEAFGSICMHSKPMVDLKFVLLSQTLFWKPDFDPKVTSTKVRHELRKGSSSKQILEKEGQISDHHWLWMQCRWNQKASCILHWKSKKPQLQGKTPQHEALLFSNKKAWMNLNYFKSNPC